SLPWNTRLATDAAGTRRLAGVPRRDDGGLFCGPNAPGPTPAGDVGADDRVPVDLTLALPAGPTVAANRRRPRGYGRTQRPCRRGRQARTSSGPATYRTRRLLARALHRRVATYRQHVPEATEPALRSCDNGNDLCAGGPDFTVLRL